MFLQISRSVKLKRSYMPHVPDMHRAGIGLGQWLQMSYSKGRGGGEIWGIWGLKMSLIHNNSEIHPGKILLDFFFYFFFFRFKNLEVILSDS